MSNEHKQYASTALATLEAHILSVHSAKSEAEWWAQREIGRLRAENEKLRAENNEAYVFGLHKGKEAAFIDYGIERLRAENEKLRAENETHKEIAVRETMKVATLRAALKPFADICERCQSSFNDIEDGDMLTFSTTDFVHLRAAAAALKETGDE